MQNNKSSRSDPKMGVHLESLHLEYIYYYLYNMAVPRIVAPTACDEPAAGQQGSRRTHFPINSCPEGQ